MSADKKNPGNDKIYKVCAEMGYCCPYAFFLLNSSKHDTRKRLAKKLGLAEVTIKYNRHRLKVGELKCENSPDCKIPQEDA